MAKQRRASLHRMPKPAALPKAPSGIPGLDEITMGGLPRGRATLVCGSAGCGKTLFGMHFLVSGAVRYGEPGVFLAFEEREQELMQNVASLGFDLESLIGKQLLALDHLHIDRTQIEESGEYDLEGLFLRLELAIEQVGAKRVVIDTLETIFGGLSNHAIVRSELRRLFAWLKDRGLTAIITAERGDGTLTRHGLEEYVSDCVIALDHRVTEQVSTRRLRIVKYRGSSHGTNEYPFLIDQDGFSVLPITSAILNHEICTERVPTGLAKLDQMLGGEGYYRGSSILVSGTAGTGKSSVCTHFAEATCKQGRRCLYVSYEESPEQITRNMASIGFDLSHWTKKNLLRVLSMRSTTSGLEGHLVQLYRIVNEFSPEAVIIDPAGSLIDAGTRSDAHLMMVRLVDMLKSRGVTAMLSNLTRGDSAVEHTDIAISSIVDTWLLLKTIETDGERNRGLYVLKSRGMQHSNQIREFRITSQGIELLEPYIGAGGVLTGSARLVQEAREALERRAVQAEVALHQQHLEHKRQLLEQRILALRAEFSAEEAELSERIEAAGARQASLLELGGHMAELRGAAADKNTNNGASPKATTIPRSVGAGRAVKRSQSARSKKSFGAKVRN